MSDPRRVTFRRDGRRIEATEGQSIAAALWAHGDRTLSRSTKYHRPRGYSCGVGKCADCHMRVDGVPNVKTCITPVREGMEVEGQNAWPSVRRDLFRVNDLVWARGFDHHRAFIRPRFLYPLFGAVIRRFAGWGRMPDEAPPEPQVEELRPDVLVIGGGPAGLAAAESAAQQGAKVLLVEELVRLGGSLARTRGLVEGPDGDTVSAEALLQHWTQAVHDDARIDVRTGMALAAAYRGGIYLARGKGRILAVKAPATVVATGSYPAEAHFEHNERPGVLRVTAAMQLLHVEKVQPGKKAVVYGAGADGLTVARDLHTAGVTVTAVVEPRGAPPGPQSLLQEVRNARIPILTDTRIVAARGWSRVHAATIEGPTGQRSLECDHIVVALGRKTTPEFFQALGARLHYDPGSGGAVPVTSEVQETEVPGLFAAGDCSGIGTLRSAAESGRIAGAAAAAHARSHPGRAVEVPA